MAHFFVVAIFAGIIIGLILWAHFADQRAFERTNLNVCHRTAKHCADLALEVRRAEARRTDPAEALGGLLAKLANTAMAQAQAN